MLDKIFRRGPKTTEFWVGLAGTIAGLFMVKEAYAADQILTVLSPALLYVFGRNAVKAFGAFFTGREAGEKARDALLGEDDQEQEQPPDREGG